MSTMRRPCKLCRPCVDPASYVDHASTLQAMSTMHNIFCLFNVSRGVLPVSGLVLGGDMSCDSTIVNTCPSNCILMDARSGCIYCKSDCQSASHQVHTQPSGGQGSGTGPISGSGSQPWTCDLDVMTSCPSECITLQQPTGCAICRKDCASTGGSNLPTSAPSIGYHVEAKTTQAPSTGCPQFPSNCPHNYIKFENGCLVCTILQQVNVQPIVITTTTPAPVTCMPIRCVSPCRCIDSNCKLLQQPCPALLLYLQSHYK
ncbi:hypothetical protein ACJMK2_026430 [Sinanodonta woodiana]|uniref:Uncharacterized protein n=1 Tax=Sinanodonta woodiana TaxID=1069815 RepID=A0ABD3XNA4_SINWO